MTKVKWALLAALALLVVAGNKMALAENYPKLFIVDSVNISANEIELRDANGFIWAQEGTEDWVSGDYAVAIMDDNDTPEIFDDSIEVLHYAGYPELYE